MMNNGTMADMLKEAMQKKEGPKDTFAIDRNEEGNDIIADDNFPVMRNKDGEYILDMQSYEDNKSEDEVEEQAPKQEQEQTPEPPRMMGGGAVKRYR